MNKLISNYYCMEESYFLFHTAKPTPSYHINVTFTFLQIVHIQKDCKFMLLFIIEFSGKKYVFRRVLYYWIIVLFFEIDIF